MQNRTSVFNKEKVVKNDDPKEYSITRTQRGP